MATGSELASAWISIYPKFSKDFNSSVTKAVGDVGSSVATKMGATLSVTLGNVFARVIDTALDTIAQHAGDAIERADILNNFPIQMANFGYAADDAEASIEKLHDAVMGLPTALDSIANATARLAPMRSSLGDATDLAIALNNAIVAGGQSTVLQKNAMEQFSQMLAVNKVDVVAWRSVINAMPAQMQQLTDSIMGTGHSVWDLYEAMKSEDGKSAEVSFEDFIEHLMKLNEEGINGLPSLAEQARNATFGIGTAMQNVTNRIADAGARIIDGIGRDRIATAINDVSKQFGGWADKVVGFIQAVDAPTVNLAGSLLTLGSTIKNVIVQSGLINTQTIVDALWMMSDILDNHISPFISGFGGRLTSALATLRDVLSEATRGFLDWFNAARYAFNASRGYLTSFGYGAYALARQVGSDLLPVINTMMVTYIPLLSRGLAYAAGVAQSTYGRIYPGLSRIAHMIVPLIADGIRLIMERFAAASTVIETVVDLAADVAEAFAPRLVMLASEVLPHVDEALKAVASRVRNLYDAIAPTLMRVADVIVPALANAIERVIMLISSPAIERVAVTVSSGIASVLFTVISELDSVFDILEDVVSLAADVVDAILPRLVEIAQDVLPQIVSVVRVIVGVVRTVYDRVAPPLIRLADTIIPALYTALDTVVGILEGPIGDAFSRMTSVAIDAIGMLTDRFPGLFDSVLGIVNGPLADAFGNIADAATRAIEAIGARLPDVVDTAVGLLDGPIGDAFSRMSSVASAAIDEVAERFPGLLDKALEVVNGPLADAFGRITDAAMQCIETIGARFPDVLDMIVGIIDGPVGDAFFRIADVALDVIDTIADRFPGLLDKALEVVNGPMAGSFERITDAALRCIETIGARFPDVLDMIVGIIDGPVGDAFFRIASVALDVIDTIAGHFPGLLDKALEVVNGPLAGSFERITDAALRCIETIGARFPDVLDIIVDFIEGPVADAFVSVADFAADVVTGVADRLPQLLGYVERLWGVVVEIGEAVKPVFDTLFGGIAEDAFLLLQTILTTLFGTDFSVADPFGDVSKLDYVLDSLLKIADIITGSLSDPFGGESGKSSIIDFITDVAEGLGELIKTLTFLTRTVLVQLRDNLGTIFGTFTDNGGLPTVSGIFETIGKVITFVVTNVMDLFQAITNGIASLKPEVIERIKDAIGRIGAVLAKLWADNKETILSLVERTVPLLAELLAVVAEGIAGVAEALAPNITGFIQDKLPNLMTKLESFVSNTLPDLLDKVEALAGWLTPDRVWTIMKMVAGFMAFKEVTQVFNGAMTWLHRLRRSFDTLHEMSGRLNEFTSGLKGIPSRLFGKNLVEDIDYSALTDVGESIGETITDGVAKGIAGSEEEVIECVATIIDDSMDDMPSLLPDIDISSDKDPLGVDAVYRDMLKSKPLLPEGSILSHEELDRMKADVDNLYEEMFKAPERLSLPESTFGTLHENLSWMQETTKAAADNTTVTAKNFERMQDHFNMQDMLSDGPWWAEIDEAEWSNIDKELEHNEKLFESLMASDHRDLDGMNAIYQKIQKENERLQSIKLLPPGYVPSQEDLADMHGVFQKMQAEYEEFYQSTKLLPSGYVPSQEDLAGMREAYEKIFNSPKLLEGGFSTEQLENMREAYEKAFGGVGQKLLPEGGISTEQLKGMREAYEETFSGIGQKLLPGEVQEEVQTLSGAFKSVSKNAKTSFSAAKTSAISNIDGIGLKIKGLGSKLVEPFSSAKGKIAGHLKSIGTNISTTLAPGIASIGTKLGTSLGSLTGSFAGVGTKILGIVSGLGESIVAIFTGPVGVAALIVGALVAAFVAFTPEGRQIFGDFVDRIKTLWDENIVQPFSTFMETVKQVYEERIKPHVDNLMKALEPAAKILLDAVGDVFAGVKGIFDFLNSPDGRPILDAIADVIGAIIDALALLVRIVMTVFSIARRLSQLIVTISGNLIAAVHNFFDSIFNDSRDQWGYGEWTEPLHGLGEDLTSLWKDDQSFLAGPMNSFGEGLINVTDAINANTQATTGAQAGVSTSLKEMYETTEAARANQIANSTYPLNTKPVQVNIDGKKVAQATTPAITTAGGTYVMSYQRGM